MRNADREYIFNSISSLCDVLNKSTEILCEIIDANDCESIVKRIASYEDEADNIFHDFRYYYGSNNLTEDVDAVRLLNVAIAVESLTDDVDDLARDFYRYNVTEFRESAVSMIINIDRAATQLMKIVVLLRKGGKTQSAFKDVIELDHFKVEASRLYDINMNRLFSEDNDPLDVIRWNAILNSIRKVYESFESAAEACGKYIYGWE